MTISLDINGTTYFYPETGDTNWGPEATDWAQAVTTGMLQKAGGLFILLDEVDFGTNFGIKSLYYKSTGAAIASDGILRLTVDESIGWRNNADSSDLLLGVNGSDKLTFNGAVVGNFVSVSDTNSIDLTLSGGGDLTADLKLSAASADPGFTSATLSIETDGLQAQTSNASIIAAIPNASSSVTGLLTNTDWTTFNNKQAAGSYITALTGDVTAAGPGSVAATIANSAVTLAKMADLAANSIIGNNTGISATPLALTATQTTAMLNNFVGDSGSGGTKGLVLAPSAGDAAANKFLSAGGTWTTLPSGRTSPFDSQNYSVVASLAGNAITIALKNQAGSNPSSGDPAVFSFRDTASTTGGYTSVQSTAATSITVSSGSTLGQLSGVPGCIYVYALNNSGTVELAVSGIPFNEQVAQTTTAEGGAGAADSDTVLYTTTARTSKAIRLIALIYNTQATAGTWVTSPSSMQLTPSYRPLVEYSANSSTADANDSSSYLYSSYGFPINYTITGTRTRECRYLTDINVYDRIAFQASVDRVRWIDFQWDEINLNGNGRFAYYQDTSGLSYGIGITGNGSTAKDLIVSINVNRNVNGNAWGGVLFGYWRLVKISY